MKPGRLVGGGCAGSAPGAAAAGCCAAAAPAGAWVSSARQVPTAAAVNAAASGSTTVSAEKRCKLLADLVMVTPPWTQIADHPDTAANNFPRQMRSKYAKSRSG